MSSAITTYYNAMVTRVGAVLTAGNGWARFPDAYSLEENPDAMMRQGWGLKLGAGVPNQFISGIMAIDRTFTVVICREVMKTELDSDGAGAVDLQLLEDARALVADFETNVTLNTGLGNCSFQGDSGIIPVQSDMLFRAIELSFTVKVIEQI